MSEIREAREKAHEISRIAMWDNLVKHYFTAYEIALTHSSERREEPREFAQFVEAPGYSGPKTTPDTCLEGYLCSE